jgi:CheY-like chemotaxis protein
MREPTDGDKISTAATTCILLVEDYPTNQKLAEIHLDRLGYQVDLAKQGNKTARQLRIGSMT